MKNKPTRDPKPAQHQTAPDGASLRPEIPVPGAARKADRFFWIGLILFALSGLLLFRARLDLMGDDADYILDGWLFIHDGQYPSFRSSLYGMTMGLLETVFGTNVLILKLFSFACAVLSWIFLYRGWRDRVASVVLYPVLLFAALSHYMQYYTSSNLSEAFFMMVQYGYLLILFSLISRINRGDTKLTGAWLVTGLGGLMISLGKNVAALAPFTLTAYFLFRKQWKNAGLSVGVFLLFKIPYEMLIRAIFGTGTVTGQMGQVMAKDLYHPEYGTETVGGFFGRFWQNAQIYLSGTTLKSIGVETGEGGMAILALILMALLLYGLRVSFVRKNDYMQLTGLYVGIMTVVTFFALQPAVAQDRIFIILIPLCLLIILYGLYDLAQRFAGTAAKWVLGIPLAIFGILILINTGKEIEKTFPELTENLGGDTFYGYTPDWADYLEMGQWVADNIPADSVVAARKPNSLTVYCNGRPFYGIYKFPTDKSADELLEQLRKDRVSYMILASIRLNPEQYIPNYYISTLHNWVSKISEKYPEKIKMIHQTKGPEPSYLIKIEY